MLKRIYLMIVAKKRLGEVIAFPAGMGRLCSGLVRRSTFGGLTLEDHDGDFTAVPWKAIDQILWGKTFDENFARRQAKSREPTVREDEQRPALSAEEIAEFLAKATACAEGSER
jgi:hypothetical protein